MMYLHIGGNKSIQKREILGIFDLDTATVSQITRKYLNRKTALGKVSAAGEELPRSFVVTRGGDVILSQISPQALRGRSAQNGEPKPNSDIQPKIKERE